MVPRVVFIQLMLSPLLKMWLHRSIQVCYICQLFSSAYVPLTRRFLEWAHEHWVWFSHGQQNQVADIQLVHDYLNRGIPVGGLDVDSEWSTGINNMLWDLTKYPNATAMISELKALGVHTLLWITSMIDEDSSNFAYAKEHGYFIKGMDGVEVIKWWHGHGAFIDYTNPEGLAWWHSQMDALLDIGVDGFKTDGTDGFVYEMIEAIGYNGTHISPREYATAYYSDFFNYPRSRSLPGPEGLIMCRPVDSFFNDFYHQFAPRDVVFAGWVGDQDPTFSGLIDALNNMFHSAWDGYVNFGSDIGGYRGGNDPPLGRSAQELIRWAQVGAFNPLMENGGDNEHRPWMFASPLNDTTEIYKNFTLFHTSLKPFFLSAAAIAYQEGRSVMQPLAKKTLKNPDTFCYTLNGTLLICPVTEASSDNSTFATAVKVIFPPTGKWSFWFDSGEVHAGGTSLTLLVPFQQAAVFQQVGSLLPLEIPLLHNPWAHLSTSNAPIFPTHPSGLSLLSPDQRLLLLELRGLIPGQQVMDITSHQRNGLHVDLQYEAAAGGLLKGMISADARPTLLVLREIGWNANANANANSAIWVNDREAMVLDDCAALSTPQWQAWALQRTHSALVCWEERERTLRLLPLAWEEGSLLEIRGLISYL